MNKICNEMKHQISLYIDGELPDDEKQYLDQHLGKCPKCREQLASFQKTSDMISSALAPAPDIDFDEVWKNVKNEINVAPSLAKRFSCWLQMPKIWIPATAVACTAAFIFFVSVSVLKSPQTIQVSRVESVSSQSGMYMVLETAQTRQPLIWFSEPQTKESQS